MNLLFLDTETHDKFDPRIVQLGCKEEGDEAPIMNELFRPPLPIAIEAMSKHHITEEMVAEKPSFEASGFRERLNTLLTEMILVAHNAPFDVKTLKNEGVTAGQVIDTMRVAKHLFDSPSYALQYLRYLLKLKVRGSDRAHDAEGDVNVLEALFWDLARQTREKFKINFDPEVLDKMLELTNTPVLMKTILFGDHKGQTFESLAQTKRGYLGWLISHERKRPAHEQSEDLIYTLKHYLDKYPKVAKPEEPKAEPAQEEAPKADPATEEDVPF